MNEKIKFGSLGLQLARLAVRSRHALTRQSPAFTRLPRRQFSSSSLARRLRPSRHRSLNLHVYYCLRRSESLLLLWKQSRSREPKLLFQTQRQLPRTPNPAPQTIRSNPAHNQRIVQSPIPLQMHIKLTIYNYKLNNFISICKKPQEKKAGITQKILSLRDRLYLSAQHYNTLDEIKHFRAEESGICKCCKFHFHG